MTSPRLIVPTSFRRSQVRGRTDEDLVDSAVLLIEHMAHDLGLTDLSQSDVLDIGCGIKFTQAFLNRGIPVRRYVGVDVYREMVDWLRANIDDDRFDFHHVDAHNERYNPSGRPMSDAWTLPVGHRKFDVICLFSVFTHLAPHDYVTMLRIGRKHIRRHGRLFFTLYIDELTDGGYGLMDGFSRAFGGADIAPVEEYVDLKPEDPLKWALYSRRYAQQLVEENGWRVLDVLPPGPEIQHHMVCAPA